MKNVLAQYKGGGYSGCFWEWNYAFFDKKEKFHNILATGSQGCENLEDWKECLKEHIERQKQYPNLDRKNIYFYCFDKPGQISEFIKESADQNVLTVAKWFAENLPEYTKFFDFSCEECGCKINLSEAHHNSYKGNGGIGIQLLGKVCEGCFELENDLE
jgi:hypothetical protein